jgi:hypothetical protein
MKYASFYGICSSTVVAYDHKMFIKLCAVSLIDPFCVKLFRNGKHSRG